MITRHRASLTRVALIVLIVLGLAGAGVLVRQTVFGPTTITADFTSATAIYPGDEVRVAGVKVGKITSIDPAGDHATLTLAIDHGVAIPADAKAIIGSDGIGCEPASAVTLAGIKKLIAAGQMRADEDVIAILTGHVLKDPDYTVAYHAGTLRYKDMLLESKFANAFVQVPAERDAIFKALGM